jgi:PAS domain S-box-containing protein
MQADGKLPVEGVKFETVAKAVPDVIVVADQNDNILFVNQKAEVVFGYSEEEILHLQVSDLMPERYRESHRKGLSRYINTGEKHIIGKIIEVEGLRKNGQLFPLELSLTCWKQEGQYFFMGIMRDITERKSAISEIASSRESLRKINIGLEDRVRQRTAELDYKQSQLKLITDSLPVLISYINKDYTYTFGNRLYYSLKNTGDSIAGKPVQEILEDGEYAVSKPYLEKALRGETVTFQNTLKFKDQTERRIQLSLIPDYSETGEVRGVVVLGIDHTERIRYEEELKNTNEQLGKINQELDNFVYSASHDLKAPVLNIEGLLESLSEDLGENIPESVRNDMSLVSTSVKRLKKILEDLSGISRVRQGLTGDVEKVNVNQLIKEIEETIKPEIDRAGAEIQQEVNESCISFSVSSLRSILYNLISNAIKYRFPGRKPLIKIITEKIPGYFIIKVSDNGLGISAENQNKIFGIFKRLHTHVEGSGVGLFLVKRIIDNAGGKIQLRSEVDRGSEFSVYIPLPV